MATPIIPQYFEIPYGYCHCGCGQKTNIATKNDSRYNTVKGEPRKYLENHTYHMFKNRNAVAVFWSQVAITADDNQCWLWQGCTDKYGYGFKKWRNKTERAYRIAWMYPDYVIPDGMEVCHSCDVPGCCNPKHLFIGTHQDNMDDRDRKGRARTAMGEAAGSSKLTELQVKEIRERYARGGISQNKLGKEYGIATVNIWMIIHRKAWKHVE